MEINEIEKFIDDYDFTDFINEHYAHMICKDNPEDFLELILSSDQYRISSSIAKKKCIDFVNSKIGFLSLEDDLYKKIICCQLDYYYMKHFRKLTDEEVKAS